MHILTLPRPVELLGKDKIEAGSYLCGDEDGAHLLVLSREGQMKPWAPEASALLGPETKSILFIRPGGYGDLIMLTPVLRAIKARLPSVRIGIVCFPSYAAALEGLPFVDEFVDYPLRADEIGNWDCIVPLERSIELNPDAEHIHATDIFFARAGVPFEWIAIADKKPAYHVKPSEAVWAEANYPRTTKRRVAIQVAASSYSRRYPLNLLMGAVKLLLAKQWEVFLLGQRGDLPKLEGQIPAGLHNLTVAGLTFRESCAILNAADAAITPDSALMHVAGALNVPCVALFGPFKWQVRTSYSPSIHPLRGDVGCDAPCFHHVNQARQDHFPKHCPSQNMGHCALLADIKPERIVSTVEKLGRDLRAK